MHWDRKPDHQDGRIAWPVPENYRTIRTKRIKMKEELQEILDDHRSQIIDMLKEDAEEALVVDVEANLDRMITEINELLGSSYD